MGRRTYEGRYLGGGRWEVRRRPRWVSAPVRAAAGLAIAAGCAAKVWRLLGGTPDGHAVQVAVTLAAVAALWVVWRVWRAT